MKMKIKNAVAFEERINTENDFQPSARSRYRFTEIDIGYTNSDTSLRIHFGNVHLE